MELLSYIIDIEKLKDTIEGKYFELKFPEEWKNKINYFSNEVYKRYYKLKVNELNETLETIPEIIKCNNFINNDIWIISEEEIDRNRIIINLKLWINRNLLDKTQDENIRKEINEFILDLKLEDLEWKVCDFCFDYELQKNNTIKYKDKYAYDFIPYMITKYLASSKSYLNIENLNIDSKTKELIVKDNKDIQFKQYKNNLISIPIDIGKGKKRSMLSINIEFKLATEAWCDKAITKVFVKTSRWVLTENIYNNSKLYSKNNIYAYLMNGDENEYKLDKLIIKYDKDRKCNVIHNLQSLEFFRNNFSLPEAEEILKDPSKYFNKELNEGILVIYNTMLKNCDIKALSGTSPAEKMQVDKWLLKELDFINSYFNIFENKCINKRVEKSNNLLRIDNYTDIEESIFEAMEENIILEILYDSEHHNIALEIKDYISEICDAKIKLIANDKILSSLEDKDGISKRILEINEVLDKTDSKIGTIVLLNGISYWNKNNLNDPKQAIRTGLYLNNRVNQFISVDELVEKINKSENSKKQEDENNIKSIIRSSFLDLITQLGFMQNPISFKNLKSLEDKEFDIYGVSLLCVSNEYLPTAIKLSTYNTNIKVKNYCTNWQWKNIDEAIIETAIKLYNNKEKLYLDEAKKGTIKLINDIISSKNIFRKTRDKILLLKKQGLSRAINGITNNSIQINSLEIDGILYSSSLDTECKYINNVRIIRVDGDAKEVGQYYAQNEDGTMKQTNGLYSTGNIYRSIAKKSSTQASLTPYGGRIFYPNKMYNYPKILEIVPFFMQDGDDIEEYVYAIHTMREMNPVYTGTLEYPLPIHIISRFEEVIKAVVECR